MDDLYREEILEHWKNPLNFGVIDNADLVIEQVNPLCGDEVIFYFKFGRGPVGKNALSLHHSLSRGQRSDVSLHDTQVSQNSKTAPSRAVSPRIKENNDLRISDVKFTGSGCAISIAAASILSEVINGKRVKELESIGGEDVLEMIGGKIAPARLKCAFLSLEAIKKAISY